MKTAKPNTPETVSKAKHDTAAKSDAKVKQKNTAELKASKADNTQADKKAKSSAAPSKNAVSAKAEKKAVPVKATKSTPAPKTATAKKAAPVKATASKDKPATVSAKKAAPVKAHSAKDKASPKKAPAKSATSHVKKANGTDSGSRNHLFTKPRAASSSAKKEHQPLTLTELKKVVDSSFQDYSAYHEGNGQHHKLFNHGKSVSEVAQLCEAIKHEHSLTAAVHKIERFLSHDHIAYHPHSFATYLTEALADRGVVQQHLAKHYNKHTVARELNHWIRENRSSEQHVR